MIKYLDKDALIQEIILVCKASNCHAIDEILLSLAFRSQVELIKIARTLHIHVEKWVQDESIKD